MNLCQVDIWLYVYKSDPKSSQFRRLPPCYVFLILQKGNVPDKVLLFGLSKAVVHNLITTSLATEVVEHSHPLKPTPNTTHTTGRLLLSANQCVTPACVTFQFSMCREWGICYMLLSKTATVAVANKAQGPGGYCLFETGVPCYCLPFYRMGRYCFCPN